MSIPYNPDPASGTGLFDGAVSISTILLRRIAHRLGGAESISSNRALRITQEYWGSAVDLVQGFRSRGNVIVGSGLDFCLVRYEFCPRRPKNPALEFVGLLSI
jgi:hypothetical protein